MNQRHKALKMARQLNDPSSIIMIIEDLKQSTNNDEKKPKLNTTSIYLTKTAAAYWKLLKKASETTKVNKQAHQLKKDDGAFTTDDTERATINWPRGRNSTITRS